MKKVCTPIIALVAVLFFSCSSDKPKSMNEDSQAEAAAIFPKGSKITNNNFTGTAWLQMLVDSDTSFNTSVDSVFFEQGARTKWHYHPGGQILLVTSGKGRYQEQGQRVKELTKGDVVKCASNVVHWHGVAPGSEFTHLAISTNTDKGSVVWLKPVSDEEYNNLHL